MVWGGRKEEGSGWGTRVYLWWIHVDIWQNQYNIVKLNNKIKLKKNRRLALLTGFINTVIILPPLGNMGVSQLLG